MLPAPTDFEAAFGALPGSVLLLRPDAPTYTVLGISDDLLALVGLPRAAVLGQGVAALHPGPAGVAPGLAALRAALGQVLRTAQPAELPPTAFEVPGAGGGVVVQYWAGHTRPVPGPDGAVRYLLHTATLAAAPAAAPPPTPALPGLPEVAALPGLLAQAPVAVLLPRGSEVVLESINAAMLHLMGRRSAAEVLGRPLQAVLPPAEAQAVLPVVQQVLATGQPHSQCEVPVVLPGAAGEPESRYFNVWYTPLLVGSAPPGVLHLAQDVTEQVRARHLVQAGREALLASEERFRIMADAAPNSMWALTPDKRMRYVNRAFLTFLGVSWEEYLATSWTAFLHPDDAAAGQAVLQSSLAERYSRAHEFRVRRHDGQYRWLLVQGAPAYYASGALYAYVGSAIDITDLKETNEQLARTNADLDNFIYTASHDLKAPITNVEGLLAMLERVLPPAARVGHIDKVLALMHDSITRFRRTLHQLTDIVRLQQTHAEEATLVDLPAVLDEVCLDLDPQLRETGAQVVRELLPCHLIRFSARNLRSIVYNLVGNALKYRAPGRPPVVELACHATPQHYVLVVRDNGVGFAPERAEQLFGMYQRLHDHVEGSGVGLYLVRRMLEGAGGRIEATGQPGVGATFTVYFRR